MHSHYKQTGFTANWGGTVVNIAQTALQTMKTLSDGDNARVRTMNMLLVKESAAVRRIREPNKHVLERTSKGERKPPKVRKRGLHGGKPKDCPRCNMMFLLNITIW